MTCRPGYDNVPTSRAPYPSTLHPVSPSPILRTSGGTNSPIISTPLMGVSGRGTPRLTRVPSTRGSPTQEQLTATTSNLMNHQTSSPPRSTTHSPTEIQGGNETGNGRINSGNVERRVNGDGSGGMLVRNPSFRTSRHVNPPLTRQDLYRSRNFLHHDLQLPDGYGECTQLKYSKPSGMFPIQTLGTIAIFIHKPLCEDKKSAAVTCSSH